MRIHFLSHYFPPEVNAPAVRTHAHCREWVARGHDVHVVTCFPSHPTGRVYDGYRMRWYQHEVVDGIHVHRIPTWLAANKGRVRRTLNYVSFVPTACWRCLRLPVPDLVIATSPQFFVAVAGWLTSRLRSRPWFFEVRDLWPASLAAVGVLRSQLLLRFLERVELHLYRSAAAVIVVTRSFADDLVARGIPRERLAYVPNGVDLGELACDVPTAVTPKSGLGLGEETHLISYIGTVGIAHGLETLLAAAQILSEREVPAHVVIAGDGAEREGLEALARERGLDNVTFLGQLPRTKALELLRSTDIAVVLLQESPVFETVIPTKLIEAMGAGKPVVLGVRGEARDILQRAGAGVVVPPGDPDALADAITELADDPDRRATMGRLGSEFVARNFSRKESAATYLREMHARLSNRRTI